MSFSPVAFIAIYFTYSMIISGGKAVYPTEDFGAKTESPQMDQPVDNALGTNSNFTTFTKIIIYDIYSIPFLTLF